MQSIGIIGLPNAGKSTLFKSLTEQEIDIASYPFTTVDPNEAIVNIPDSRLEKLAQIVKPETITPATTKFIDVAGLVKDAHKGEGLGNQFLSQIQRVDLILHVIRAFKNRQVSHPYEEINPEKDAKTINLELILKDRSIIQEQIKATEKKAQSGEKQAQEKLNRLEKMNKLLEQEKLLHDKINGEQKKLAQKLNLLTAKPILYLINGPEEHDFDFGLSPSMTMNIKEELELNQLPPEERKEFKQELKLQPALDQTIKACYNELNLVRFYTLKGGSELRAWSVKRNTTAEAAAGKVHSDFQENFIKAKVIQAQKLIQLGSWKKASNQGGIKTAGKDYIIKEGDVVEFVI